MKVLLPLAAVSFSAAPSQVDGCPRQHLGPQHVDPVRSASSNWKTIQVGSRQHLARHSSAVAAKSSRWSPSQTAGAAVQPHGAGGAGCGGGGSGNGGQEGGGVGDGTSGGSAGGFGGGGREGGTGGLGGGIEGGGKNGGGGEGGGLKMIHEPSSLVATVS